MLVSESFGSLERKVVVITGGSRGIGHAVATAVIENGASVVIGDILEEEGQLVVEEFNKKAGKKVAAFIRTDVTKYIDNQNLFKLAEAEFGGVDCALLNAGIGTNANSIFTPMDDELEQKIFDVNLTAVIKGTKVALLHMAKRGGGSIVHMASMAGLISLPALASYNASKHAVVGYTRSFELMPQICNVRVNAVCPYWVETDMVKSATPNPFTDYVNKCAHTEISTVVDGVLGYFIDRSKNIETAMALPDGLHVLDAPEHPASVSDEETVRATAEFSAKVVIGSKMALAKALEAYGI